MMKLVDTIFGKYMNYKDDSSPVLSLSRNHFQLTALVHVYRQLPNVSAIFCGHLQGVHS